MTSYRDWVVETSSTTGTGSYDLSGSPPAGTSYFTFRQRYSNGEDEVVYWVVNANRTKWEKNRFGTLTYGSPDTLSRNVVESINGDAPVSWVGGDAPLRIYVAPDADAAEFAISMGLGAARPDVLKYGLWAKDAEPSAGFQQLNIYDGAGDIPAGIVNATGNKATLYGLPRSYLAGLTLSRSSATVLGIAAGEAMDSTNVLGIYLAAFTKSTAGAWAAGSGSNGMGNGLTIANSTWYHVFAILNAGLADVYFDTSVAAANKPTGTTHFRRIGSFRTDGSAQIIAFSQQGDEFIWSATVGDINQSVTTAVSLTLTVPTGVVVWAKFRGMYSQTATNGVIFYPLDQATQAVGTPTGNVSLIFVGNGIAAADFIMRTNTSAQIGAVGVAANAVNVNTYGWIDRRGRDG